MSALLIPPVLLDGPQATHPRDLEPVTARAGVVEDLRESGDNTAWSARMETRRKLTGATHFFGVVPGKVLDLELVVCGRRERRGWEAAGVSDSAWKRFGCVQGCCISSMRLCTHSTRPSAVCE